MYVHKIIEKKRRKKGKRKEGDRKHCYCFNRLVIILPFNEGERKKSRIGIYDDNEKEKRKGKKAIS